MMLNALTAAALLIAQGAQSQEPDTAGLSLEPAVIRAGMFYSGSPVRVRADVPAGLEISISCKGEEGRLELNKKGKVLGLIWMSVGDVSFEPFPDLYLLATSSPIPELGDPAILRGAGVGYEALEARVRPDDQLLFQEALHLKEGDGLFGVEEDGVRMEATGAGSAIAEATFFLPAKAPTGEYRILVHGFGPDGSALLAQGTVTVVQTGAAAFISALSVEHGLAYGILAVVIAVGVGLITGVIFGMGSKKGH